MSLEWSIRKASWRPCKPLAWLSREGGFPGCQSAPPPPLPPSPRAQTSTVLQAPRACVRQESFCRGAGRAGTGLGPAWTILSLLAFKLDQPPPSSQAGHSPSVRRGRAQGARQDPSLGCSALHSSSRNRSHPTGPPLTRVWRAVSLVCPRPFTRCKGQGCSLLQRGPVQPCRRTA